MDSITILIRDEIKRQYKSVKKFSEVSGIPYSTLSNALTKGVGGTSYDTVIKICKLLNLKHVYDVDITIFNDQFYEICSMLSRLDDKGVHAVRAVLTLEYNRCETSEDSSPIVKPFNGLVIASKEDEND